MTLDYDPLLTLRVLVCSQLAPVLPLGAHMGGGTHCCYRVLFPPVYSCFLHCAAIVHRETFVTILIETLVPSVTPVR